MKVIELRDGTVIRHPNWLVVLYPPWPLEIYKEIEIEREETEKQGWWRKKVVKKKGRDKVIWKQIPLDLVKCVTTEGAD